MTSVYTSPAPTPLAGARQHIGWVDAMRVLACLMVVLSHCCDGFVAQFDADRASFLTGTAVGSLMRPCVPLFAMMTGVLLLPVPDSTTLGSFYSKRLMRLVWPLVFWSLALPCAAYLYFAVGPGIATANPSVDMSAYTPEGLTTRLWTWLLNFNFDTTPLWYLYMLVGLYFVIPVVGAWLRTASRRDVATFLKVWAITLFVPYIKLLAPFAGYPGNYGNMDVFGGCDWNAFTAFHYVSGFIGYIVLAYYLKTYPLAWSRARKCAILIPMFLAGYAITFGGYVAIQGFYPGDYAYLEIIWLFTGVNVMMMTVPVFVAIQSSGVRHSAAMQRLAGLTFGIYLCHFFFVMVGYDLFNIPGLPYIVRIAAMCVFAFTASALLVWLLQLWRPTARLVK